MKLVETQALSVTLRGGGIAHIALNGVSVCIEAGQHTALLGPNGAGKSTLLKVLHGAQWPDTLASPTAGAGAAASPPPVTVSIPPPVMWYPPPHETGETSPLVGRAMSALVSAAQHEQYVRQGWDLSGKELLLTGFDDSPLLYTLPQPKQEQRVQNLARTLRLEHLLGRSITTLSQGQMRLLLLARALVRQPALLLLDECLDGLDPIGRDRVLEVLDEVRHSSTIIVSSHRWHSLPTWIHTTLYMQGGRVCRQPATAAASIAAAQTAPTATPFTPITAACLVPPLSQKLQSVPATSAPCTPCAPHGTIPPPLVSLTNVDVYVERAHILHDITWTIKQGEHWVLRGANGSGKSTLLRLLAGDEYPALGGSIERNLPRSADYTGEPTEGVEAICELDRLRRGIRLVSDAVQAGYDYDLSGQELVLSGFDGSVGLYRDFTPAEHREARYWLQRVGMADMAKRTLRSVSTGQARRLFIARALVGRPDILLLDEPCSGLDSQSRADVLALLSGLAADNIHTVLVSHHGKDRLTSSNRQGTVVDGRLQVQVII